MLPALRSCEQLLRRSVLPAAAILVAVVALAVATVLPVEAAPAPTVTAVSPALGPSAGGTSITITGTGFASGATVTVGGSPATSVTFVSASTLTAVTPAGTPGGAVVTVTNTDSQSATLSGAFTFQYPPPTTASIAPAAGSSAGGTSVTITGTQFRTGATVTFGSTAATSVTVASATSISATVPPHAIGATSVTVANSDGQSATLAGAYTYTAASAPTVTSAAPATGSVAGGTSVVLTGSGFVSGATVTFDGVAATSVTVSSATSITAITPSRATTGAVAIAVSNPDTQTGILASGFTYIPRPAPTISTITPTSGAALGGTSITVTGTGFVAGATLSIGGTVASSVAVASATTITALAPQRTAGAGSVVVTNPDGQSATLTNGFTSNANSAPTATSIAPTSGTTAGGDFVTITGTNFLTGATVLIGGVAATDATVVSATTITATTPAHAAGSATVMVKNYDGQAATTSTAFTYNADAAPTLTTVSPNVGPLAGGTAVTLTGTGFKTGATVTVGAIPATTLSVTTTSIHITTPAGLTTGPADVVVTNPDSQIATSAGGFTYQGPAPTVTGITPDGGPTDGGTVVSISGSGFLSGATVTFGGTAATAVTVNSDTQITATTPTQTAAGAVDVSVANPNTAAAVLSGAFNYRAAGTPNVADTPPAGGIVIAVSGTTDVQALIAAQKFTVSAVYLLDVAKQTWKVYVVGAPAVVDTLTTLKATDIVLLRR